MAEKNLFDVVTVATGLPSEGISNELDRLLKDAGLNRYEISLEDLRRVVANYLQDVLLAAKEDYEIRSSMIEENDAKAE